MAVWEDIVLSLGERNLRRRIVLNEDVFPLFFEQRVI